MIVRDAGKDDLATVHRLIGQLGYPVDPREFQVRFERVAATSDHRIFVAEESGGVVGVLHAFVRPALEKPCEVVVQALVVEADRRSTGVGEALMREAEAWAGGRGLSSTALYTRIDRDRSRAFYERLGYRLKGTSHLMGRS
jgi:GNAT superfamily N-acetyltransferase